MRILVITIICTGFVLQQCFGIKFLDLPASRTNTQNKMKYAKTPIKRSIENRRQALIKANSKLFMFRTGANEEEKDANLKNKISTLVQQTLHDTERKIKSVQHLKENNRHQEPYKAGFILSMIKKTRDVLNELFNVAVKHRDEWKALEQLKIFELIVHTNVDTTNLVRQLVEIHVSYLNSTNSRRVVLL